MSYCTRIAAGRSSGFRGNRRRKAGKRRSPANALHLRKIWRFRARDAFPKHVFLLGTDLLVLLTQAIGVGGQGCRLAGRLGRSRDVIRRWLQDFVTRRRYFSIRNLLMYALQQNQNLFYTAALEATGVEIDLFEILSIAGRAHLADRETLGEDTVVARRVEPFTAINLFFILNVVH